MNMNMLFRTIQGYVAYVEFYKESSNLKIVIPTKAIIEGPMQNYFLARIYILPLMVAKPWIGTPLN